MKSIADFGPMRERDQLQARDPKRKKMILEYQIAPGHGLRGLRPPSAPAGRAISGIISDQHAIMPVLLELMKYSDASSRFISARGGLHHCSASDYY